MTRKITEVFPDEGGPDMVRNRIVSPVCWFSCRGEYKIRPYNLGHVLCRIHGIFKDLRRVLDQGTNIILVDIVPADPFPGMITLELIINFGMD